MGDEIREIDRTSPSFGDEFSCLRCRFLDVRAPGSACFLSLIAAGVITQIWNVHSVEHEVDPTLTLAIGILTLAMVVAWAHNEVEDKTEKGILKTDDRMIGE